MNFFSQNFCLYDCLTGEHTIISKTPFKIGSGEDSDLRLNDQDVAHEHCVIYKKDNKTFLVPNQQIGELILAKQGDWLPGGGELEAGQDYTLCIGSYFFALRGDAHPKKWLHAFDPNQWFIFDTKTNSAQGPFHPSDLPRHLSVASGNLDHLVLYCQGLTTTGFPAGRIMPHIARLYATPAALAGGHRSGENALPRFEVAPEDFRDGFFGADGPAFVARARGPKSLGHGIEGHIAGVGIAGGQLANPLRQVVFGEFAVRGVQGVPEGLARYLLAAPVNLVFWMPIEVRGDRNKGAFCAFTHMLRV